jgi:uncharacterized membrane protein YfcA
VGTDLVQAIPLVGSAVLGHVLFGDFHLGLTVSLLVGALPGVYVGARLSSRAPDHVIRPALVLVLAASGAKLLGMSTSLLGLFVLVAAVVALAVVLRSRRRRPRQVRAAAITASASSGRQISTSGSHGSGWL